MARAPDIEWGVDDYLRALWLHKWVILFIAIPFWGFTAVHMAQKPDIYRAACQIVIQADQPQPLQFEQASFYEDYYDDKFYRTEYQMITSPAVMQAVIEDLHLADFPPFQGAEDPTEVLAHMVKVESVRGTRLVNISVEGPRAHLIARIANSVADNYARFNLERKRETATGGIDWLQKEVDKMQERVQSSRETLQRFMEEHGTVDFSEDQQSTTLQQLQQLNTALSNAREQRIEAETKYLPKHPKLLEIQAKEQELQVALLEVEREALEMNRLAIQFNRLEEEAKINEGIYTTLLTRLKELSVEEGLLTNNVKVVRYAKVPSSPIAPDRGQAVTMAALLGVLAGAVVAVLWELSIRAIRTRRDFEHLLEIPFLGSVSKIRMEPRHAGRRDLFFFLEPNSLAAESLRSVRTTLEFLVSGPPSHVILMTSAVSEEGKTLVSFNLACALQEMGRRVVYIEADMRRPRLHQMIELSSEVGLSDYLQDQIGLDHLIQVPLPDLPVPVIPAGPPPAQSTDLLASDRMKDLIKILREQFQYVLIDTPPVLAVADTAMLTLLADGAVYVVRAGRLHRDVVLAGKRRLVDVGAKIIGGILNDVPIEKGRGYRYSYYRYNYQSPTKVRRIVPPAPPRPTWPLKPGIQERPPAEGSQES